MKKFTVLKPMVTSKEYLLINGDVIYIEELQRTNNCGNKYTERKVYSPASREYLGNLNNENNLQLEKEWTDN